VGYFRGLIHGVAIGTLAGLALAPQPGQRTREQVKDADNGMRSGRELTGRAAQRVAPVVGPMAQSAMHAVDLVRRRRGDEEDVLATNGAGADTVHTPA
jgi:gas vesicle protein